MLRQGGSYASIASLHQTNPQALHIRRPLKMLWKNRQRRSCLGSGWAQEHAHRSNLAGSRYLKSRKALNLCVKDLFHLYTHRNSGFYTFRKKYEGLPKQIKDRKNPILWKYLLIVEESERLKSPIFWDLRLTLEFSRGATHGRLSMNWA